MSITDPLIGSQLGDYRIVDMLGRGGMARVYRGYDEKLDRYAAVKVIDAQLANEREAEYRQRFLHEARAIARLNHPNIVGVYQFGEVGSLYYMAMAFVEGRDLGQILREYGEAGRLPPYHDILRIMRDMAGALDHAHAGGVIHRDVKPSNILIAVDGHAVLTDFGLALSIRDGSLGNTFGSAHYIAPEQAVSSASVVPQSDLYSLGVVLYQMLVGRVPFDDRSTTAVALKHVNDTPPPLRMLDPTIPRALEVVTLRLLAKDPARRYKSGKAMLRALERAMASVPESERNLQRPATRADVASARSTLPVRADASQPTADRRRLLLLTLVGLLVVVFSAGLALLLSGTAPPANTAAGILLGSALTRTGLSRTPGATQEATIEAGSKPVAATLTLPPTAEPTASSPPASPTVTASATKTTVATPTATQTMTASPTRTPTVRPVVIAASPTAYAGSYVELKYDERSLVVYNPTDRVLDLSNLQFVQLVNGGSPLTFRSNVWRDVASLKPGACLQVWTDRYIELRAPAYCEERQSWQAVSFLRWFWISEDESADFDVRRGEQVLARCNVSTGSCSVRLQDDALR